MKGYFARSCSDSTVNFWALPSHRVNHQFVHLWDYEKYISYVYVPVHRHPCRNALPRLICYFFQQQKVIYQVLSPYPDRPTPLCADPSNVCNFAIFRANCHQSPSARADLPQQQYVCRRKRVPNHQPHSLLFGHDRLQSLTTCFPDYLFRVELLSTDTPHKPNCRPWTDDLS